MLYLTSFYYNRVNMSISSTSPTFCDVIFGPYCEGASRIKKAFGPLPKPLETASCGNNLALRVKLLVTGAALLLLPVINMIIYLAIGRFNFQTLPTNKPLINQPGLTSPSYTPTPATPPHKTSVLAPVQTIPPASAVVTPNYELQAIGLPNFGTNNLFNICWMNAATQVLFRSPKIIERIFRDDPNPAIQPHILILFLRELYKKMKAKQPGKIKSQDVYNIQERLIEIYKKLNGNYTQNECHDAGEFINVVFENLKISISTKFSFAKNFVSNPPEFNTKVTDKSFFTIAYTQSPGKIKSYQETLLQATEGTTLPPKVDKKYQSQVLITSPPSILGIRVAAGWEHMTQYPLYPEMDFSYLFTKEAQDEAQKTGKSLRYRWTAAAQHSKPGTVGHYMAIQQTKLNHYDDSRVTCMEDEELEDEAITHFRNSPVHIWERIED